MKRLIFIRHAATADNAEKKYVGCRTDTDIIPPDPAMVDCTRVAVLAKLTGKTAYYYGPMKRVQSTAKALFPDENFTLLPDMYEIDFGDFEGRTFAELKDNKDFRAWIKSGGMTEFPGGEGRIAFTKRTMSAVYEALKLSEGCDTAVIVCHGGSIMAIMGSLTGGNYYDFLVDNLDGYAVDIDENDEGISVKSYDRLVGRDFI